MVRVLNKLLKALRAKGFPLSTKFQKEVLGTTYVFSVGDIIAAKEKKQRNELENKHTLDLIRNGTELQIKGFLEGWATTLALREAVGHDNSITIHKMIALVFNSLEEGYTFEVEHPSGTELIHVVHENKKPFTFTIRYEDDTTTPLDNKDEINNFFASIVTKTKNIPDYVEVAADNETSIVVGTKEGRFEK